MSFVNRIRRWLHRTGDPRTGSGRGADPSDLHPGVESPADARTGLDRPFPAAGPIADPPIGDPPPTGPPERPMG